jgi:CheY-like chemotaxis protein
MMEYAGTVLLLVLVILLIVAIVGGKVKIAPAEVTLDTPGFLDYLRKARLDRGVNTHGEDSKVKAQAEKFVKKLSSLPAGVVLWVDDHQANNINERLALAKLGIHCECYSNNDEAINVFEKINPDLVISDIGRDSGSDGFDLLKSVREKSADISFIFYTLSPNQDRLERARLGGATAIVELPDELIQSVETHITLRRFRH